MKKTGLEMLLIDVLRLWTGSQMMTEDWPSAKKTGEAKHARVQCHTGLTW